MPKFWLTEERTQTIRTLVEAPSAQAVHEYYKLKDTDWETGNATESDDHHIVSAENNHPHMPRAAELVPDVHVDATGEEIDQ